MRATAVKVTREMERIMKLDSELVELRYLLIREQQREMELNKHTLLMSRAIQYKIDKLVRTRASLMKLMKEKPSQRATFKVELARRKEALDEAYELLKDMDTRVKNLGVIMLAAPSDERNLEFKQLLKDIKSQRTLITNKERSLNNWAARGEALPVKIDKPKAVKKPVVIIEEPVEVESIEEEVLNFDNEDIPYDPNAPKDVIEPDSTPSIEIRPYKTPACLDLLSQSPKPKIEVGGGWGDPNSTYTPPPQISKVTI